MFLIAAAAPLAAQTSEQIEAEPLVRLQQGETLTPDQCLSQQELELIDGVVADPSFAGEIKRTLLLRVEPDAPANSVAAFERDLMAMPDHIPAIVNWALSRVVGPPTSRWTHCWEQEYYPLDGLKVDYMMSPHHWGLIDGWFDPEMPRKIVDLDLAHVYHATDRSVLAAALAP